MLDSKCLKLLDGRLEELDASEQYRGKVLHNSAIRLLRDVLFTFKQGNYHWLLALWHKDLLNKVVASPLSLPHSPPPLSLSLSLSLQSRARK